MYITIASLYEGDSIAYTDLIASIDNIIEKRVACAKMLWETDVLFLSPRLPNHL